MNILPGSGRKWKSLEPKKDEYTCVIVSRPTPKTKMAMSKEYLGDSAYIQAGSFCYTLTTENGMGPSNTIHLEPQIILAMLAYIKKDNPQLWEQLKNELV